MKVLLVDDEIFTIRMLQNLIRWKELGLEYIGYAQNGKEAYEVVVREEPDIIISDIRMPEMDGLEFMKKVSTFSGNIKMIVMSAYADFSFVKEAMRLGCSDYILKPIDESELEQALYKAVSVIRGEREQKKAVTRSSEELSRSYLFHFMRNGYGLNKVLKSGQKYRIEEQEYCVYMIQLDNKTIEEFNNSANMEMAQAGYISQILENILEEYMGEHIIFEFDEGCWTVILEMSDGTAREVRARRVIDKLQENTEMHFNVCFSSIGKGLQNLPMLYDEVRNLSKYSFYIGEEDILGYGYNCNRRELHEVRNLGIMKEIDQAVHNRQWERLKTILKEVLEKQEEYYPNELSDLYELCYQTMMLMRKYLRKDEMLESQYHCIQEVKYKEIAAFQTLKELRDWVMGIIDGIRPSEGEECQIYSKPVKESLAIIEAQYQNNISLEDICEQISVSKNYFCYLFKRETGMSLWNYLTEIRLRHAKQLLKETEMKSYQVAFEVGYENPSYFSKLFKQYEGMTPNEYRRQS